MSAFQSFLQTHDIVTAPYGQTVITTAGRRHLGVLFKALGYRHGAEIGVWEGRFSEQLCLSNPGVNLICVDPWTAYAEYGDPKNDQAGLDAARAQAVERLKPYACDVRSMTSLAAAETVPDGSLDFVYLDGNHGESHVLADLWAWVPKVRSGGIISGHDYEIGKKRHAHLQVRQAVDSFTAARQIEPLYVLIRDKVPSFFWRVP